MSEESTAAAVAARKREHPPVVGMVGAGQLARMTAQAAISLGVEFRVLAETASDSAAQVCAHGVIGDYRSVGDVLAFGAGCDVITFDHEHVPAENLDELEQRAVVRPGRAALRYTQDKAAMRERLDGLGVLVPRNRVVTSLADIREFAAQAAMLARGAAGGGAAGGGAAGGWPVVLKAVSGGYDGRGVWICPDEGAAAEVLAHGVEVLAEEFVAFDRELAVLVARSPAGQGACYPVVQTFQREGICREVISPAPGLDPDLASRAQSLALRLAGELGVTGLLAVELFETGGDLLVNELAMRPHNCGHWTIDAAVTSQFEQHVRAILDLPLGTPAMNAPWAVMVNVLGGQDPDLRSRFTHVMAADPGARVHLYGKRVRQGRKVGHVTVAGDNLAALRERAWRAANYLSLCTEEPDGRVVP